jgi:hypothetical protein
MVDRLKLLVHYICHRMTDAPSRLGKVQLNKILWYTDAWFYRKYGEPLTHSKYIKREWGPVARSLPPVLDDLDTQRIVVVRRLIYPSGKPYYEFISLSEPDLTAFSGEEIAMVDRVIDWICGSHTAGSISDLSHDVVWKMHAIGEEMPLHRTHLLGGLGEITEADVAWAKEA